MTASSSSSEAAFARLARRIRACRICRDAPAGAPLPHEPRPVFHASPTARILVAGQAPGARVHASGLPFDDPSGDRLRDWMGLDRPTFYDATRIAFLPMGLCFPGQDAKGGDLPPRRECAPAWRESALAALPDIRLILLIGRYAQDWHLARLGLTPRGETLGARLTRWREIYDAATPRMIILPHPSWRNNAWIARETWFGRDLVPLVRHDVRAILDARQ
ncbi:MAG: uracil-DNA glycosylase family protein [Rhizobiales bacterium]|nr:uracil-DNA glycosylase family protein [Hyphomicrobiales bacterium]